MKQSHKVKGMLEALLIIGLILIIPLFFAIRSRATSQTTPNTAVPIPPTVAANAPDNNNALQPKQPPACTFPLAQITAEESRPEEYTFSEPQVVLTDELQPEIVSWLPDNQNVLIMPLKLIDLGINGYRQTIELFNPETKEVQIYATRRKGEEAPPAWNPALNAIIYPATNVLGEDKATKHLNITRQIRISYGNPNDTQALADNLPQYYVAVKPDGSQTAYLTQKQLLKFDTSLNPLPAVSFDRKLLDYKHENSSKETVTYKMAWRPNSSQIFVYNWAYDNLSYTYILDSETGQLCNLDFGGWALVTRWSSNGRYLAIIRAQGSVPLQSSDLVVLDTATGNLYMVDVPQNMEGMHFFKDIAWAPDNHHLFIIVSGRDSNGILFLSDFSSGRIDRVLPSYKFTTIDVGTNLAWSPDGSKLLMNCPISEEVKQVCLIYAK